LFGRRQKKKLNLKERKRGVAEHIEGECLWHEVRAQEGEETQNLSWPKN